MTQRDYEDALKDVNDDYLDFYPNLQRIKTNGLEPFRSLIGSKENAENTGGAATDGPDTTASFEEKI